MEIIRVDFSEYFMQVFNWSRINCIFYTQKHAVKCISTNRFMYLLISYFKFLRGRLDSCHSIVANNKKLSVIIVQPSI